MRAHFLLSAPPTQHSTSTQPVESLEMQLIAIDPPPQTITYKNPIIRQLKTATMPVNTFSYYQSEPQPQDTAPTSS